LIAVEARDVAGTSDSEPPKEPNGVLSASTIYMFFITAPISVNCTWKIASPYGL